MFISTPKLSIAVMPTAVALIVIVLPSCDKLESNVIPFWSSAFTVIAEKIENDDDEIITSVNEKELPVYQIGDTFDLNATGEDTNQ